MDLSFVEEAAELRTRTERRRKRLGYGVSATVTLTWLVLVTAFGLWPRVLDNWVATVTMIFGSFIGGSTPQSSGAVAFPVFTKILQIPAEVARTFALCIQIVGLGVASIIIVIRRRVVDRLALAVITPTALVSFLVSITVFSDRTRPFWPTLLPGPYVKVGFSLLVLCMATIVFLGSRVPLREIRPQLERRPRTIALLAVAGVLGGFVTAQVGSGADVLFYLVAVVLLGLEPRVGVPTSVPIMAAISLSGLLYLGIGQGMLLTQVADGWVVGFGAQPVPPGSSPRAGSTCSGSGSLPCRWWCGWHRSVPPSPRPFRRGRWPRSSVSWPPVKSSPPSSSCPSSTPIAGSRPLRSGRPSCSSPGSGWRIAIAM